MFVRPFRRYDPETGYKYWEAVTSFERGMVYLDGTVGQLIQFTGWQGKSTLYFGDQIYADLADITLFYGWRTAAIIHELEVSLSILSLSLSVHLLLLPLFAFIFLNLTLTVHLIVVSSLSHNSVMDDSVFFLTYARAFTLDWSLITHI